MSLDWESSIKALPLLTRICETNSNAFPVGEVGKECEKIHKMSKDLQSDVKQLTYFTPEYRLRVGDYRVLFELEGKIVNIYRIRHRKQAYK